MPHRTAVRISRTASSIFAILILLYNHHTRNMMRIGADGGEGHRHLTRRLRIVHIRADDLFGHTRPHSANFSKPPTFLI